MSVCEASITNPKKQLEFYRDLSEQLQQENQQLKRNCNIGNENLNFYKQQLKELQQRIEKAIGYIENELSHIQIVGKRNKSYLLQILKGEEK